MHSHLIPGIDDGSKSISDSLEMIRAFEKAGFQKIITTPHVHPKYPNSTVEIQQGLMHLQQQLQENKIDVELEAAAEYYVDETFLSRQNKEEPLLTFGDRYLLIECSFFNKSMYFTTAVHDLQILGYRPVLAHPERYLFLEGNLDWLMELKGMGVLFQLTLGSVSGYYGEVPRRMAMKLLKNNMVDFIASDLHRMSQFQHVTTGLEVKEVQRLMKGERFLNHSLL